jgi:hypothetical protein
VHVYEEDCHAPCTLKKHVMDVQNSNITSMHACESLLTLVAHTSRCMQVLVHSIYILSQIYIQAVTRGWLNLSSEPWFEKCEPIAARNFHFISSTWTSTKAEGITCSKVLRSTLDNQRMMVLSRAVDDAAAARTNIPLHLQGPGVLVRTLRQGDGSRFPVAGGWCMVCCVVWCGVMCTALFRGGQ